MSEKGASIVAGLLKHQRLNRDSAMWQDTLRLRHPHLDGMRGLRRITLNYNPQIGDAGAATIAEALLEDLWIKAVDLQHCGIGADGGLTLRKVLDTNQTLEVLDIRKNPFIPDHVVNEVMNHLHDRQDEYSMGTKYEWLDPCDLNVPKEDTRKPGLSREPGVLIRSAMKEQTKENSQYLQASSKKPTPPSKAGIPWRVEHRLYERREGLKPGSVVDSFFDSKITTPLPVENSDGDEKKSTDFRKIKKLLYQYKKMYRKEQELRKRAERKFLQLQTKLNTGNFLDDGTVEHIETCFRKFQTFLFNLKAAGFHWQSELWDMVADSAEVDLVNIANPSHSSHLSSFLNQSVNSISDEKRSQHREQFRIKETNGVVPQNIELLSSSGANIPILMRNLTLQEEAQLYVSQNDIESHQQEKEVSKFSMEPESSSFRQFLHLHRNKLSGHNTETVMHHEATSEMLNVDCNRGDDLLEYSTVDYPSKNRIESQSADTFLTNTHIYDKKVIDDSEKFTASSVNEMVVTGTILSSNITDREVASEEVARVTNDNEVLNVNQSKIYSIAESNSQVFMDKGMADNSQDMNVNFKEMVLNEVPQVYFGNSSSEATPVDEAEDVSSNNTERRLSPIDYKKGLELPVPEQSNENDSKENPHSFLEIVQMPINTENVNKILDDKDDILAVDNSRSETPGLDSYTHRSETDDEKLQMRRASMKLAGRRSGSVSSVSITEQLSQSHSDWVAVGMTKPSKNRHSSREKSSEINIDKIQGLGKLNLKSVKNYKPEQVKGIIDYDSDFEVSDVEGLSISASSLTSTTIPDDLVTPGEEEF